MTERNAARSRERILAAALAEFGAKGFAGARVDSIARRARINKRMLYHYFGDKAALYGAVLREKLSRNASIDGGEPLPIAEELRRIDELLLEDPDWIRLLEWEALEGRGGTVIAEPERTAAMAKGVARTKTSQGKGSLPTGLDPSHLRMALLGVLVFPHAFPQAARMLTGRLPTDAAFRRQRRAFLAKFGEMLETAAIVAPVPPAVVGSKNKKR